MARKKGGYGLVYQNVMRDKSLSPEAKAIYAYLCSFAGKGETCYPGADMMRDELRMSKERFYKHIKQLTDAGIVRKVQERPGGQCGKVIYHLTHFPEMPL